MNEINESNKMHKQCSLLDVSTLMTLLFFGGGSVCHTILFFKISTTHPVYESLHDHSSQLWFVPSSAWARGRLGLSGFERASLYDPNDVCFIVCRKMVHFYMIDFSTGFIHFRTDVLTDMTYFLELEISRWTDRAIIITSGLYPNWMKANQKNKK